MTGQTERRRTYLEVPDLERRWYPRAACAGEPMETFFSPDVAPGKDGVAPSTLRAWEERKEICRNCPVLDECRRDTAGEIFGIWGGLDPIERRSLRRLRSVTVRQMAVPEARRLAAFAKKLDASGHFPITEIQRVMGLNRPAVDFLVEWKEKVQADPKRIRDDQGRLTAGAYRQILALRRQGVVQREIAERLGVPLNAVQNYLRQAAPKLARRGALAVFPEGPPLRGDAWIRHDNRCMAAWYEAQSHDGQWYRMRVRFGFGNVVIWLRQDDVKMTRTVEPVFVTRHRPERSHVYGKTT